jgi:hypothetical protein
MTTLSFKEITHMSGQVIRYRMDHQRFLIVSGGLTPRDPLSYGSWTYAVIKVGCGGCVTFFDEIGDKGTHGMNTFQEHHFSHTCLEVVRAAEEELRKPTFSHGVRPFSQAA